MALKQKCQFLVYYASCLLCIASWIACANIRGITGGSQDTDPPKLLKARPENFTKRFSEKRIMLLFDEYFRLRNPYREIDVTPEQRAAPQYTVKKKMLLIDFKDSLASNTTYVINFGHAIEDEHEGNILKNFTYVFSTGDHIDSLSISGTVVNAFTKEREKDISVFIFPLAQDSLLGKKPPAYHTITDSLGNFKLKNIKKNIYKIYALKEQSANRTYDDEGKEQIAFLKNAIDLQRDTNDVELRLFQSIPEKFMVVNKKIEQDGTLFFTFNKALAHPDVQIIDPSSLNDQKILDFSKNLDTLEVYLKRSNFDSIKVALLSKGQVLDTVLLRQGKQKRVLRKLLLFNNLPTSGKLKPADDLQLTSNYPISTFDVSRIVMTEDAIATTGFQLQGDTAISQKKFLFKYLWKADKKYDITFNEGAFTSMYGQKSERTSIQLQQDRLENYASITLDVLIPDPNKAYVVELLDKKKNKLASKPITQNSKSSFANHPLGKYFIRVVYDRNKNKQWDTGNFKEEIQPEELWYCPKAIILRRNWAIEEKIVIPNIMQN